MRQRQSSKKGTLADGDRDGVGEGKEERQVFELAANCPDP